MADCPALRRRIEELPVAVGPSKRTLAVFTADGQVVSSMVKREDEAVEPAPLKEVLDTVPSATVWLVEDVLTVQAVSVILPVKLIVPSAAFAYCAENNAAAVAINVNLFMIFPLSDCLVYFYKPV